MQQLKPGSTIWSFARLVQQKSIFEARATHLKRAEDVQKLVGELKCGPAASATHTILAWKCGNQESTSDGGEPPAGQRLLNMLKFQKKSDILLVVNRWYGGVKMGTNRFKAIDRVGLEAVQLLKEEK